MILYTLLGFAEANPSADIDGIDAQRKIIILSALASGILADGSDVYAETLRNITMADIDAADRMNAEIKLIAQAKIGDKLEAYVCPMIVPHTDPLSHISDVYNGISVTSPVSGDMMYYGRGAGRYPTAGAVMADAVAVLSGAASSEKIPVFEKKAGAVRAFDEIPFEYYIRAEAGKSEICDALLHAADEVKLISDKNGTVELVVGKMTRLELGKALEGINVISVIRVKNPA